MAWPAPAGRVDDDVVGEPARLLLGEAQPGQDLGQGVLERLDGRIAHGAQAVQLGRVRRSTGLEAVVPDIEGLERPSQTPADQLGDVGELVGREHRDQ